MCVCVGGGGGQDYTGQDYTDSADFLICLVVSAHLAIRMFITFIHLY